MRNGKRVFYSGKQVPKSHHCYKLKSDAKKALKRANAKRSTRKSTRKSPRKSSRKTTRSSALYTVHCRGDNKCRVYKVKQVVGHDNKKHKFIVVNVNRQRRVLCLDSKHKCYKKKSDATKRAKSLNVEPFRCKEFARNYKGVLYSQARSKEMMPRLGKDCNGQTRLRTLKVAGRKVHRPVTNTTLAGIRGFDRSKLRTTGMDVTKFGRRFGFGRRLGFGRPMNYGFRRFI